MSDSYEDILKRQYGQIQKIKVLPTGTWRLKTRNASFQKAAEEGKNPAFMFVYVPVSPADDVDEGQLAELGANYDVGENRIFYRVWYETGRDLNTFFEHVKKHGVEVTDGMSIEDALKAVKGKEIMAYLGTYSYKNRSGETVTDNDAESFAPVA